VSTSHDRLAEIRARRILARAGLDGTVPIEPLDSVTNQVWRTDDHVVRVNRRLSNRLRREAFLHDLLPPELGLPELVAAGEDGDEDWIVLERVPGRPLAHCWPEFDSAERRAIVHLLAEKLRLIHTIPAPAELAPLPTQQLVDASGLDRFDQTLDRLRDARVLSPLMAAEVQLRVADLVPALEHRPPPRNLVHGDLTFENLLWDGERLTVLDFEWARADPCEMDLDVLLRCCGLPHLHVAEYHAEAARRADYADVPHWVAEIYPELYGGPGVFERLELYALGFELHLLDTLGPGGDTDDADHPGNRLARIVDRTSYLHQIAGVHTA
jgi:aminoglycoside phosphotransferase (APT) family kinase protein